MKKDMYGFPDITHSEFVEYLLNNFQEPRAQSSLQLPSTPTGILHSTPAYSTYPGHGLGLQHHVLPILVSPDERFNETYVYTLYKSK